MRATYEDLPIHQHMPRSLHMTIDLLRLDEPHCMSQCRRDEVDGCGCALRKRSGRAIPWGAVLQGHQAEPDSERVRQYLALSQPLKIDHTTAESGELSLAQ